MIIKINNIDINYAVYGTGAPIILLHGWGGCIDSWYPITEHLKKDFCVYVLDLPGFGKSETPATPFDYYTYGDLVAAFIKNIIKEKPIVIGHSFGGSIAAGIAARYPHLVIKIILADASGIRIRSLRIIILSLLAEVGKNIFKLPFISQFYFSGRNFFYKIIGEEDYLRAGKLKLVFSTVIRQDITHLLPEITCPVLLLWGKNDKATPLWQGELFHSLIPNSKLVVIPNCGHFAYLENPESFLEEVEKFIKQE